MAEKRKPGVYTEGDAKVADGLLKKAQAGGWVVLGSKVVPAATALKELFGISDEYLDSVAESMKGKTPPPMEEVEDHIEVYPDPGASVEIPVPGAPEGFTGAWDPLPPEDPSAGTIYDPLPPEDPLGGTIYDPAPPDNPFAGTVYDPPMPDIPDGMLELAGRPGQYPPASMVRRDGVEMLDGEERRMDPAERIKLEAELIDAYAPDKAQAKPAGKFMSLLQGAIREMDGDDREKDDGPEFE